MKALWLKILALAGLVMGWFWLGSLDSSHITSLASRTSPGARFENQKLGSKTSNFQNKEQTQDLKDNLASRGLSSLLPNPKELSREMVRALLEDPNLIPSQVSFQQGAERFTSLPGVYVIPNQELRDSQAQEVIGSFLGLSVIRTDNPEMAEKFYSLVVEKDRGALALVTGNLKVAHSDSITAKQLEEAFGLKLLESFAPIGTSIFSTPSHNLKSLLQLAESIRSSSGVERVTLDLIDRARKPQ